MEANRRLVELLIGRRRYVMQEAREGWPSWTDIGAALGTTEQETRDWYRRKIAEQEEVSWKYDLPHETERARRALRQWEPGATRRRGERVGRAYLDVPYVEKDQAKAAGARWDPGVRRWYDPQPPTPSLRRWAARADVPEQLPGEDRTFGAGLFVDLVPASCWFTNVRTCVSRRDWERLRRMILRRAGQACEICGATDDRATGRRLEAHERWAYDRHAGVQVLRRLICLCSPCHLATHFGHASVTGRADQAFAHLRAVTGMTHQQALDHIRTAEQLWLERSGQVWELDLGILTDASVTLNRPAAAADRAAAADCVHRELNGEATTSQTPRRS